MSVTCQIGDNPFPTFYYHLLPLIYTFSHHLSSLLVSETQKNPSDAIVGSIFFSICISQLKILVSVPKRGKHFSVLEFYIINLQRKDISPHLVTIHMTISDFPLIVGTLYMG